jgi:TolB-like protein
VIHLNMENLETRRHAILGLSSLVLQSACASTSSTLLSPTASKPNVAILPLHGLLGVQASDLIAQELTTRGIAYVEPARVRQVVTVDTDLSEANITLVDTMRSYGQQLGVKFLLFGTITTDQGPLSSYPHVFITLRLYQVETGSTIWIGRYGNSLWSSAISTQGDLQRGARDLASELVKSGAGQLLVE